MYTKLGFLTKDTIVEVDLSELGLVTALFVNYVGGATLWAMSNTRHYPALSISVQSKKRPRVPTTKPDSV